jgi:diguanylate cyclase (GGDEF)-like protein/PAS domain S-box-containing protein
MVAENKPEKADKLLIDINNIDFKTLAEDVPVMIWLTNLKGEIIFSNSIYKNFIGRENVDKLGGKAWFQALHPDDQQMCLDTFEDAFQTHKPFEMEYRLKRRDGQYRYLLDRGEPYINKSGQFSGFVGSSTDISDRKDSEDELKKSHKELIQYNHEMSLINQLNSYLQVCRTLPETYPVISHYADQIFPDWSGSLYLFNESKTLVESVTLWGVKKIKSEEVIAPDDCWALRQGREHIAINTKKRLPCNHVEHDVDSYTCVPIIAQGEMLGMLHMEYNGALGKETREEKQRYFDSRQRLMKIASDNLALSLVSLNLREALKHQSIRDPLTSLFNRRYMEECLQMEVSKSARSGEGLGVIMTDIDLFKNFNDTYGHDAGDNVLVEFSKLLASSFRDSDIVCRYGGEEFIIIMPSAALDIVMSRATKLCEMVRELEVFYDSSVLPKITASFGVAHLSNNRDQASNLVKLADSALYSAKRAGRDQIVLYEENSVVAIEDGSTPL